MEIGLLALTIFALPFLGSLLIIPFAMMRKVSDIVPRTISPIASGASLLFSIALLTGLLLVPESNRSLFIDLFPIFEALSVSVRASFQIDMLSASMLLVVQLISFIVTIYSLDYMRGDDSQPRYFAMLGLFAAMMNLLVLAGNPLLLFFGWEGMGAISYLFVIYNRRDGSILHRSLRVFLMNRAADIFYLIALFASLTLASEAGISDYTFTELNGAAARLSSQTIFGMNGVEFIVLMFFLGSAAKSAQFPLHVWLSDAMTAPTPISALIHAATMVTAGVYLLLRIPELILAAPAISEAMIVIGIVTASLAGLQALFQYQIKRVLAYSTVSQLGYMIAAVGAGAFSASFAHLITHAFAKSLLFLAAGGVMMRLHHEQDMRRMGGLHSSMKFEALLFFAGTLSISGVFPLAGFFSKTDVVRSVGASIQSGAPSLYLLFASVSLLTPLYLFRAYFMIFTGARRDHHLMPEEHAVVGSARLAMAFALLLSLTSGFIYCISNSQTLIAELIPLGGTTLREGGIHPATIASSIAFGLAGMALAYTLPSVRARMNRFRSFEYTDRFIRTLIDRNYFLDDIYLLLSKGFVLSARAAHRADSAIDRVVHAASGMFKRITLIADSLERVIDRIIHFPVSVIFRAAGIFQTVQTGYIHHYLYYAISAAVLMAVAFIYTL